MAFKKNIADAKREAEAKKCLVSDVCVCFTLTIPAAYVLLDTDVVIFFHWVIVHPLSGVGIQDLGIMFIFV